MQRAAGGTHGRSYLLASVESLKILLKKVGQAPPRTFNSVLNGLIGAAAKTCDEAGGEKEGNGDGNGGDGNGDGDGNSEGGSALRRGVAMYDTVSSMVDVWGEAMGRHEGSSNQLRSEMFLLHAMAAASAAERRVGIEGGMGGEGGMSGWDELHRTLPLFQKAADADTGPNDTGPNDTGRAWNAFLKMAVVQGKLGMFDESRLSYERATATQNRVLFAEAVAAGEESPESPYTMQSIKRLNPRPRNKRVIAIYCDE